MDFGTFNNLFNEKNPKCEGCPIEGTIARTCILDYELESQKEILFVSDYLKMFEGDYTSFRTNEYFQIWNIVKGMGIDRSRVGFTSALKCPLAGMKDIPPKAIKQCGVHLMDTIDHYKPKLVFSCGKTANSVFYGKNVKESSIRGVAKKQVTPSGHEFYIVSIFHPWQVISEPKNSYLFKLDIENSINKIILGLDNRKKIEFDLITSVDDLNRVKDTFVGITDPVSVDIETTGLNFLEDTIHTVSLTRISDQTGEIIKTIVLPIDHKEAKISYTTKAEFIKFISRVVSGDNRHILQKANFDLKFLMRYGVTGVKNVWDCKLLQHLKYEEVPKSLSDLVRYYFPTEI